MYWEFSQTPPPPDEEIWVSQAGNVCMNINTFEKLLDGRYARKFRKHWKEHIREQFKRKEDNQ